MPAEPCKLDPELTQKLLEINDQYLEIVQCNSFFCDAVVAIFESGIELDENSVNGFRVESQKLRTRLVQLGLQLDKLV